MRVPCLNCLKSPIQALQESCLFKPWKRVNYPSLSPCLPIICQFTYHLPKFWEHFGLKSGQEKCNENGHFLSKSILIIGNEKPLNDCLNYWYFGRINYAFEKRFEDRHCSHFYSYAKVLQSNTCCVTKFRLRMSFLSWKVIANT